jgi:hypothetical protein
MRTEAGTHSRIGVSVAFTRREFVIIKAVCTVGLTLPGLTVAAVLQCMCIQYVGVQGSRHVALVPVHVAYA